MRDYGKVHSKFWASEDIRGLSDDGRMLALYLMTSPHSTIAGVFRLPDGYVCEDMKWAVERVAQAFSELLAKGFANRCETSKWVWVAKHLEWNPPENPNQRKSAAKIAHSVPVECCWRLDFITVCGPSLGIQTPPPANPSPTLLKPLANQEQEQKAGTGSEDSAKAAGAASAKTKSPEDLAKAELWKAAVSLFTGQGMPEPQARQFFGKLAKDFPDGSTVTDALRNCIAEQPADARAWLTAECQRLAGARKPSRRPTSHSGLADKRYTEGVTADGTLA